MTVTSVPPPPTRPVALKPTAKTPRKPPAFALVILSGMACALLFFIGFQLNTQGGVIRVPGQKQPLFSLPGNPGQRIILVMGVDAPNKSIRAKNEDAFDSTRTDTMMLVRVDGPKHKVSVVSIPRDSKVYLSGNHGIDKINAAHAIGGPDMAVSTVQDSFGIPVDNFMVINFRGVRELVEAIGGIDIYIDKAMHYTDRTAKLFIDFQPGTYHLDGRQAEAFLRFRHDQLGDIGRIRRQQQFITAVAKKLREPAILFRIPQLVDIANKYVETDMSVNELAALAFFGKDVNLNNIRSATLPGHPGGVTVSYWVIDPESAQLVLDRLILDNQAPQYGYQATSDTASPIKIGLYYDAKWAPMIPAIEKALTEKEYRVVCRSQHRQGSSQIIEHTSRTTDNLTDRLRSLLPGLANARLIFAPIGTTFENNACSGGEDYTLILGADSIKKR